MKTSIDVIKYTLTISLISLVATYLITVNIESDFIPFNTVWMSNNFLLTIFGGVFASTLVVLLCEIQKYHLTKLSNENQMYYQALYLYGELFLLKKNIEYSTQMQEEIISDNFFDYHTNNAMCQRNCLLNIEYLTFSKKYKLNIAHKSFCDSLQYEFTPIQNGSNSLKIAINEERIKKLKANQRDFITSKDELVLKVLFEQSTAVSDVLAYVDKYLEIISETIPKKFNWKKDKKLIHDSYKPLSSFKLNKNIPI